MLVLDPVITPLVFYVMISLLNVTSRYLGLGKIAKITKPMLIPFLILALIGIQINHQFTAIGILATASLFFGWIGDIFLLKHGGKHLIFGGLSFGLGHICTIISSVIIMFSLPTFYPLVAIYTLLLSTVVIIASYYVFKNFHQQNPDILRSIGPYLVTYIALLSIMFLLVNSLHSQHFSQNVAFWFTIAGIGAFSFFMSDWTLLRAEFKGTTRIASGTWMILYLFGQWAISFGLFIGSYPILTGNMI